MSGPRRWWPQVRAAFVVFHVLAMILLSTPRPRQLDDPEAWDKPRVRRNFAQLTELLRALGLPLSDDALRASTWELAQGYLQARGHVVGALSPYVKLAGIGQGWRMFVGGGGRAVRLHLEVREAGRDFRPAYVRGSSEHRWLGRELDYHRMRKLDGWAAKGHEAEWAAFGRWLAGRASRDFPDATHLRVRSFVYRVPDPERMRADVAPSGRFERVRVHALEALR